MRSSLSMREYRASFADDWEKVKGGSTHAQNDVNESYSLRAHFLLCYNTMLSSFPEQSTKKSENPGRNHEEATLRWFWMSIEYIK